MGIYMASLIMNTPITTETPKFNGLSSSQLLRAFNNSGHNGNKFVSVHSGAPDVMTDNERNYGDPLWTQPYDVSNLDTFDAVVPKGTIVFLFSPDDYVAKSHHEGEILMRQDFASPNAKWMFHGKGPTQTVLHRYAKVYFPGDQLYNQQMVFSDNAENEEENYFDIFDIMGDGEENSHTNGIMFDPKDGTMGLDGIGPRMMSYFKKETYGRAHNKNLKVAEHQLWKQGHTEFYIFGPVILKIA